MLTKLRNRTNRAILVIRHARAMWRALTNPKNERKGDWRGIPLDELLSQMDREVEELKLALWQHSKGECGPERVEEEGADVSCFVAFISDANRMKRS